MERKTLFRRPLHTDALLWVTGVVAVVVVLAGTPAYVEWGAAFNLSRAWVALLRLLLLAVLLWIAVVVLAAVRGEWEHRSRASPSSPYVAPATPGGVGSSASSGEPISAVTARARASHQPSTRPARTPSEDRPMPASVPLTTDVLAAEPSAPPVDGAQPLRSDAPTLPQRNAFPDEHAGPFLPASISTCSCGCHLRVAEVSGPTGSTIADRVSDPVAGVDVSAPNGRSPADVRTQAGAPAVQDVPSVPFPTTRTGRPVLGPAAPPAGDDADPGSRRRLVSVVSPSTERGQGLCEAEASDGPAVEPEPPRGEPVDDIAAPARNEPRPEPAVEVARVGAPDPPPEELQIFTAGATTIRPDEAFQVTWHVVGADVVLVDGMAHPPVGRAELSITASRPVLVQALRGDRLLRTVVVPVTVLPRTVPPVSTPVDWLGPAGSALDEVLATQQLFVPQPSRGTTWAG